MTRLLVTLNVIVLGVLLIYILNAQRLATWVGSAPLTAHYQAQGQGTLALLNAQVAGMSASQRDAEVQRLKAHFPYGLALKPIASLPFDRSEVERLNQGRIVVQTQARARIAYGLLPNSGSAWEVPIDQRFVDDERSSAQGTLFLLTRTLYQAPPDTRRAKMRELQALFGVPLSLHTAPISTLSAAQNAALDAGQVVAVALADDSDSIIYQRVPESALVVSIDALTLPPLLRHMNALLLLALASILALSTVLWLWPHWRQLMGLRAAAVAFGAGDYSARAPHRARSGISPITSAFNQMAEQTQRGIRSHKELTSAISHELRTPLARMRFLLEMLAVSAHEDDRQLRIDRLDQELEELNQMLEELLTYARADRDVVQLKRVQLQPAPWLRESLERMVVPEGKQLSWRVSAPEDAIICIDARLMRRALENLVLNAFRYAHAHIEITLELRDGEAVLCIDDDGPGIPPEERDRLFEPFAILERSRSKEHAGFGLGLAIVWRVITAHQGSAQLLSSPLGGARVQLRWLYNHEAMV